MLAWGKLEMHSGCSNVISLSLEENLYDNKYEGVKNRELCDL